MLQKKPPLRITCRGPQRPCSLDLYQQTGKEKKETVIWTVFLPFSFGISYDRQTLLDMEKVQRRLTFSFSGLLNEPRKSFWGTASCSVNVLIKLTLCAKHPACQCLAGTAGTAVPSFSLKTSCLKHCSEEALLMNLQRQFEKKLHFCACM